MKYFVNQFLDILKGEEYVLRRMHHDTPLFDTPDEALDARIELVKEQMERQKDRLLRLEQLCGNESLRTTILVDDKGRWTVENTDLILASKAAGGRD